MFVNIVLRSERRITNQKNCFVIRQTVVQFRVLGIGIGRAETSVLFIGPKYLIIINKVAESRFHIFLSVLESDLKIVEFSHS